MQLDAACGCNVDAMWMQRVVPNYGCPRNAEVCQTHLPRSYLSIYTIYSIYLAIYRYAGIFGLTGSVGGKAELAYLTKTYGALRFNVPRFLDTCVGTPRKVIGIG